MDEEDLYPKIGNIMNKQKQQHVVLKDPQEQYEKTRIQKEQLIKKAEK